MGLSRNRLASPLHPCPAFQADRDSRVSARETRSWERTDSRKTYRATSLWGPQSVPERHPRPRCYARNPAAQSQRCNVQVVRNLSIVQRANDGGAAGSVVRGDVRAQVVCKKNPSRKATTKKPDSLESGLRRGVCYWFAGAPSASSIQRSSVGPLRMYRLSAVATCSPASCLIG